MMGNASAVVGRYAVRRMLLLFAVYLVLYIVFLGVRPLFMPDEVRYAEIAREMLVSGDWIVPRLNGLLYFEKPPFGYWMNALSIQMLGENPFAVRFASAIAVAVSAFTLYRLGRRYFASPRVAACAVFVFLTTFEVQAVGTYSVLDSMFAAALNGGIALFAIAATEAAGKRHAYLAAAGLALGIAFLTKGFLAFALPVLVLVPWLLLTRQYRLLIGQSWLVVIVAVATVAPWALAIDARQPDFWRYFFWVEHVQRFAAENAQHKAPFYYFLMYLPVVGFPWLFVLPAAARALQRGDRATRNPAAVSLVVLWAIVPLLFFSIASGKLITYILPCFLPFSLFVAAGLEQLHGDRATYRHGILAAALVPLSLLGLVLYLGLQGNPVPGYGASETGKLAALVAALVFSVLLLCGGAILARQPRMRYLPGIAMIVILVTLPFAIPAVTMERKAPVDFIRGVYSALPGNTIIVTDGSLLRAASWATRRSDLFVAEGRGEAAYGLDAPDARGRFLSANDLRTLVATGSPVLVLCKGGCQPSTLAALPAGGREWFFGDFAAYATVAVSHQ